MLCLLDSCSLSHSIFLKNLLLVFLSNISMIFSMFYGIWLDAMRWASHPSSWLQFTAMACLDAMGFTIVFFRRRRRQRVDSSQRVTRVMFGFKNSTRLLIGSGSCWIRLRNRVDRVDTNPTREPELPSLLLYITIKATSTLTFWWRNYGTMGAGFV